VLCHRLSRETLYKLRRTYAGGWKDEEATGRPGPYAPNIDDGVKVNIRPFQDAGVLAVEEVIKSGERTTRT
jgi:hypothetical protein